MTIYQEKIYIFFLQTDRIYFLKSAIWVKVKKVNFPLLRWLYQNNPPKKNPNTLQTGPTFQHPKCWPARTGPRTPYLNPVYWTNVASAAVRIFVSAPRIRFRTAVTGLTCRSVLFEFRKGRSDLAWQVTRIRLLDQLRAMVKPCGIIQIACCLIWYSSNYYTIISHT